MTHALSDTPFSEFGYADLRRFAHLEPSQEETFEVFDAALRLGRCKIELDEPLTRNLSRAFGLSKDKIETYIINWLETRNHH